MLLAGAPTLDPDEQHVITVRSHPWQLARAALPLLALALLPALYDALDLALPDLRLAASSAYMAWFVVVALLLYMLKWLLFDLLPWLQRIWVITNRRVITQSGVLAIQRRECPLLKIQESDYTSRGVMARLLDIGDVDVQTSGSLGTITLRCVAHPRRVQSLISAQTRAWREEQLRRQLAQAPAEIVRQLETAIYGVAAPTSATTEKLPPISPRAARMQQRLSLLPDESVIEVARQHPLVLAAALLAPLVGVLFVGIATLVFGATLLPYAVVVLALLLAPWMTWRVLSYLAHEYVLTTDRLMELRSTPLFFEMRDVVQLTSIQDVSLRIPSLFGRLADIGDVVVEVAGPAQRVSLRTVARPGDFQQRIFAAINARQGRQRDQSDQQLVSTLSRWFQEYHKLQQGGPPP